MDDRYHFAPPRRQGFIFHSGLALIVLALAAWGLWKAFHTNFGLPFILYLIPPMIAAILLPLIIYRGFALWRAYYTLERNGMHLHWGIRVEDIPMQNILWVRKWNDPQLSAVGPIPLPIIRWPGALVGVRHLANGFPIEYMAADSHNLILIATAKRIIAISPNQPDAFLHTYHRLSELGSLSPWPARSIFPTFIMAKVWNNPPARYLILGAILLNFGLLGWVSFLIPTRTEIILGFTSSSDPVAAYHMLLLPFLNVLFLIVDVILGVYFFRIEENPIDVMTSLDKKPVPQHHRTTISPRILAYILWSTSIITTFFFMTAVFFIMMTS